MRAAIFVLLLRVTLIPASTYHAAKTYYCTELRIHPNGVMQCQPPGLDMVWVDLNERQDSILVEAVKDDLF